VASTQAAGVKADPTPTRSPFALKNPSTSAKPAPVRGRPAGTRITLPMTIRKAKPRAAAPLIRKKLMPAQKLMARLAEVIAPPMTGGCSSAGDIILLVREAGRSESELATFYRDGRRRGDETRVQVFSSWPAGVLRHGLDVPSAVDVYAALCNIDVYTELTTARGWSPERVEQWWTQALARELLMPGATASDSPSGPGA
jgi:hypothetical protein